MAGRGVGVVMNSRDKIDEVMDYFNFNRVAKTMEMLEWTWYGHGVPDECDLRVKARELLAVAVARLGEGDTSIVSTGGLRASAIRDEGEVFVRLSFELAEWEA